MSRAEFLIRLLDLKPHPEGGHYRETFRDVDGPDGRARSTAILFLLQGVSDWHRIDAVELWHWYDGAPLALWTAEKDETDVKKYVLGNQVEQGQSPQIIVPAGIWQTAFSLGDFTLVGCTVAPGFEFSKFEFPKTGFVSLRR